MKKCLITRYNADKYFVFPFLKDLSSLDPEKLRSVLEHQLAGWSNLDRGTIDEQQLAQEAWRKYEFLTTGLSQELCEQLRLVLEPALASKLKYAEFSNLKNLTTLVATTLLSSHWRMAHCNVNIDYKDVIFQR